MSRKHISASNVLGMSEKAGMLNQRIVIEQKNVTVSPRSGEEEITWQTWRTCAAQVTYGSESTEQQIQMQETPLTRAFFTIRFTREPVKTNMRISYDSRYWDIMAVHKLDKSFLRIEAQANTDPNGE